MKKLALGSLLLVALGVIGTSFALTTEGWIWVSSY